MGRSVFSAKTDLRKVSFKSRRGQKLKRPSGDGLPEAHIRGVHSQSAKQTSNFMGDGSSPIPRAASSLALMALMLVLQIPPGTRCHNRTSQRRQWLHTTSTRWQQHMEASYEGKSGAAAGHGHHKVAST